MTDIQPGSLWVNKYTKEPFVLLEIETIPFRGNEITTDVLIIKNELTDKEARWDITFFKEAFEPRKEE
tara:strand:+ start:269 stop:472 length:204 start_codon:yes stop_codon:yes gene_type:complete